jgi:hypothetical protein
MTLYNDIFNDDMYLNKIKLNSDQFDTDGFLVIMCIWKRIHYLHKTLEKFKSQTIYNKLNIVIFNNNNKCINEIEEIIKKCDLKIILYNSDENIGGIGRFVMTKYIYHNIHKFDKVIFIDDDQDFTKDFFESIIKLYKEDECLCFYGKKFNDIDSYWESKQNIWTKDFGIYMDYGATCGMIINTQVFIHTDFFKFNKKFSFVEDLWLSYFIINKLNFKIINGKDINNKIRIVRSIGNDKNAQWMILTETKNTFFNLLKGEGNWKFS